MLFRSTASVSPTWMSLASRQRSMAPERCSWAPGSKASTSSRDRKRTRLNSSHTDIYTLSLHDALPIYSFGLTDVDVIGQPTEVDGARAMLVGTGLEGQYQFQRSEENTSELQSHRYLHSFPTRCSSDLQLRSHRRGCHWPADRGRWRPSDARGHRARRPVPVPVVGARPDRRAAAGGRPEEGRGQGHRRRDQLLDRASRRDGPSARECQERLGQLKPDTRSQGRAGSREG